MSYQYRAFCPCGFSDEPLNGEILFSQNRYPVCPRCGENSDEWMMHTVKWVRRSWFKRGYWVDQDGDVVTPNQKDGGRG